MKVPGPWPPGRQPACGRAIELLNYQPNINAQALRRGTTEMIGLVLSDPSNPFFTEFAAAIGAEAFGSGRALMTRQRAAPRKRRRG